MDETVDTGGPKACVVEVRKDLDYDLIRRLPDYDDRKGRAIQQVVSDLTEADRQEEAGRMMELFRSNKGKRQEGPARIEDSAALTGILVSGLMRLKHPGIAEMDVRLHESEIRKYHSGGKIAFYYHASYRDRAGDEVWDSGEINFP